MDPRFIHPFTCMIAGPTQSGKSYFVAEFIKNIQNVMSPVPEKILWCYGVWQTLYDELQKNNLIEFHEGLPDMSLFTGGKTRYLVIIDDLMDETDKRVTQLFTKGSHHLNISVMFIVQNLFSKNKEHRTISLNSHYLVLFRNVRDISQISSLAKQMYPGKTQHMLEAYKDAVSPTHGYLLIDLRQSTPDKIRLRTDIFNPKGITVYTEK